jgi:ribosomal-protein-alanine N-acetyltransferase
MEAFLLDRSLASAWLEFALRNRMPSARFSIARDDGYYGPENFSRLADEQERRWKEGRELPLAFLPKGGGDIVAVVKLSEIVRGVFRSCYLGYEVDDSCRRQGYGKEAVKAVVSHAFDTMQLHRIEANIIAENRPSLALAESLGFRNEGMSPKYLYINGNWEDHVHMVLLNEGLDMGSVS